MTSADDSDFSHEGFTLGSVTKQALQASISDFFKGEKKKDQLGENTQERKDGGISCTKLLYLIWLEKGQNKLLHKIYSIKTLITNEHCQIWHMTCMTEQGTHLSLMSQCADSQRQKGLQPCILFCFSIWPSCSIIEAFTPDTYNVL